MKGKYKIVVRNKRVVFTLEIERNITVIKGVSATGKTTLVSALADYEEYGSQSGYLLTAVFLAMFYTEMTGNTSFHNGRNVLFF